MANLIRYFLIFSLLILAFYIFIFVSRQKSKINSAEYINQIVFKKENYQTVDLGKLKAELKPNYLWASIYALVILPLLIFLQLAFFSAELILRIIIFIVPLGASLWNLQNYTRTIKAYENGLVIKTIFGKQEFYYRSIESLNLYLVNGYFTKGKYFGYIIKINERKSIQFDSRSYKKIEDFINVLVQNNPHIDIIS